MEQLEEEYTHEELQADCVDTYDVTKKMYAMRAMFAKLGQFEKQRDEANAFFDKKAKQINDQISYLEGQVDGWMAKEGQTKLVTPAGTASYRHQEKWIWNEDADKLLAYIKENEPDLIKISTDEGFSLVDLKKRIKEKQVVPQDIVTVLPTTKLEIKLL